MLALAVRGLFLVGILTWYSTSVWRMIDGYFKDQFRTYLDEEYRKNPRMKSDVEGARTAPDKKAADIVDAREEEEAGAAQLRRIVEACQADTCPIDGAESLSQDDLETGKAPEQAATGAGDGSENGAEVAYPRSEEPRSESSKSDGDAEETPGEESGAGGSAGEIRDKSESKVSASGETRRAEVRSDKQQQQQRRGSRRDRFGEARQQQRANKQKVKTITLTAQDFAGKRDRASDPDFWEFEEDAEEKEPREGMLVADLPFKPRLEIGNLERVTADEYCPLTLEDEKSCGETAEWP